jgi:TolB-like protein/Flp pilus assembly protein TadD/DNA-binding winged helix-turn-helix (wHTH) protein
MNNLLLDGFTLDDTLVDPVSGQYASPIRSGHLPPRAVEVLLYLAKHPRRLVTREEILSHVWGGGQGTAEALSHVISDLRHAFDDHANQPHVIQTVPRRGYRLLIEPVPRDRRADTVPDEPTPRAANFWRLLVRHGVVQASVAYLVFGWLVIQVADATFDNLGLPAWSVTFATFVVVGGFPVVVLLSWFLEMAEGRMVRDHGQLSGGWFKSLERNYLSIVAAYALAVFGAGVYQATIGFEPGDESRIALIESAEAGYVPVEPNSVAILKFLSLDGSERSRLFSAGLSEDIIDRLAMVASLSVAARGDAWSLPEDASSRDVRRRLRVAFYVEGSVRLIGDDLRVVAQLIDSESGRHIMSRNFERKLDDFLSVQRDLTQLVVSSLRMQLPVEDVYIYTLGVDDAEVDTYLYYQRGREALRQPPTRESLSEALTMFERALERDPGFAAAHAGICNAHISLYELEREAGDIAEAEQACGAARAASARLPEVYTAIGRLRVSTGDLDAAEEAYQAALGLDPQDADALVGMSGVLWRRQKVDQAEGLLNRAIGLQPGNWRLINSLAAMEFDAGAYAEAAGQWQRVVFINPGNHVLLSNLGGAQILAGDFEAARKSIESALEIQVTDSGYSNLGVIYYFLGEFGKATEMHRAAIAVTPRGDVAWANLGDALYFEGDAEAAAAAYARADELAGERLLVNPIDIDALRSRAWARAMRGDFEAADASIALALRQAPDDPYSNYYDGLIKLRAGKPEEAERALAKAADLGYPRTLLAAEPHLRALHDTPGFAGLLEGSSRL